MNKEKVNELEKGGKNSLKKFWVALACWIRWEKKEDIKEIIKNKWNEMKKLEMEYEKWNYG